MNLINVYKDEIIKQIEYDHKHALENEINYNGVACSIMRILYKHKKYDQWCTRGDIRSCSECAKRMIELLAEEYKPPYELSKLEYEILKYMKEQRKCDFVGRDPFENVYFHGKDESYTSDYPELFKFIDWHGDMSIKAILDNSEIIKDN